MTALKCKWMVGLLLVVAFSIAPSPILADYHETKITAGDGAGGENFGSSVSISGDYTIVGAHYDEDNGYRSGSAYVFRRDGATWSQQAKLTASDGAEYDTFGLSVSISGDYAVVGAFGDSDKGTSSGSAYVFRWDGVAWRQQAKLTASDGAEGDRFGRSVSISGDTVVVGAIGDEDYGPSSGSAYVFFKRDGVAWRQQAKLIADDGARADYFGTSVSISGDYVAVGAFFDDDNGENSGSAYVFKRDGAAWSQQAKLTADDGAVDDSFGTSVSIAGDTVVVGANGDGDNGSGSGSAYVFRRDGVVWSQQAKLIAGDGASLDSFSCSVSVSGDYVVVGASNDDDNGSGSGSAYVFKRDGAAWSQQTKLTAGDAAEYDHFGSSVSISGHYAVVASSGDDDNGTNSGSAYVLNRQGIEGNLTAGITGLNGLPIVGATVSLQGTVYSTSSDASGEYWFAETIAPGEYDLLISKPPFGPVIVPGILVNEGMLTSIPSLDLTAFSGDADGNGQQGLEDVIYLLQVLTGVR